MKPILISFLILAHACNKPPSSPSQSNNFPPNPGVTPTTPNTVVTQPPVTPGNVPAVTLGTDMPWPFTRNQDANVDDLKDKFEAFKNKALVVAGSSTTPPMLVYRFYDRRSYAIYYIKSQSAGTYQAEVVQGRYDLEEDNTIVEMKEPSKWSCDEDKVTRRLSRERDRMIMKFRNNKLVLYSLFHDAEMQPTEATLQQLTLGCFTTATPAVPGTTTGTVTNNPQVSVSNFVPNPSFKLD